VWQRPHGRNLLKYFGRRYLIALDASSRVEFSAAKSHWVLRGVRVSAAASAVLSRQVLARCWALIGKSLSMPRLHCTVASHRCEQFMTSLSNSAQ
jgi:hypothetical protein